MTNIEIFLSELDWVTGSGTYVVGKAFHQNELHHASDLHGLFNGVSEKSEFRSLLTALNGQFAVILQRDKQILVGVDHIRTHPVFYAVFDDEIYVGDDFPAIDDAIEHKPPDRVSAMEFITAGYPSGPYTLHPDVRKMQAGEILRIDTSGREPSIETEEYFRYRQNPDPIDDEDVLLELMDEALTNAFQRTKDVADGRPLIVPLSGGYDSRLIATMLSKCERSKVYTFCDNRGEEIDSDISSKVANDLGLPWTELIHTDNELRSVNLSDRWRSTHNNIGNFGTLHPSSRHLLSFEKVVEEFKLDGSFVYLQGHTAAAPGGFMPDFFRNIIGITEDTTANTIFDYHYNRCLWNPHKYGLNLRERVHETLAFEGISTVEESIHAIEYWYWKERTPNRLLHHPLLFQQGDKLGWYPLWDREFVSHMLKVPMELRLNKKLYHSFVNGKYRYVCGTNRNTNKDVMQAPVSKRLERLAGRFLVGTRMEIPARRIRYFIKKLSGGNETCELDGILSNCASGNKRYRPALSTCKWMLQKRYNQ